LSSTKGKTCRFSVTSFQIFNQVINVFNLVDTEEISGKKNKNELDNNNEVLSENESVSRQFTRFVIINTREVSLFVFFVFFENALVKTLVNCVRWASKKSGGSSKNRKGHAIGKRRGLKAIEGEYVTQSSILLRQLGVRMHPGLNVI